MQSKNQTASAHHGQPQNATSTPAITPRLGGGDSTRTVLIDAAL
jgi:hypothetical protein